MCLICVTAISSALILSIITELKIAWMMIWPCNLKSLRGANRYSALPAVTQHAVKCLSVTCQKALQRQARRNPMLPRALRGAVLSCQMEIYGGFSFLAAAEQSFERSHLCCRWCHDQGTHPGQKMAPSKVKAGIMSHSQACTMITGE